MLDKFRKVDNVLSDSFYDIKRGQRSLENQSAVRNIPEAIESL